MPPTAKDIADRLDVSPMTVSYALRGRGRISEATRRRVLATAEALGYQPNIAARALRGSPTQTIALLTNALNVEAATAKIQAFDDAARDANYAVMMAFSPNDNPELEDRLIRSFLARRVDGIVVQPTETGEHRELRRLVAAHYPLVTLDGAGRIDFATDDVSTDYYAAGRLQVEHALACGLRRICHINTVPSCYTKDEVRRGVLDAIADAGADKPTLWDCDSPAGIGSIIPDVLVEQITARLQASRGQIDVILSYDLVAAATLRAAYHLDIVVPDELAIIGFDNSPIAQNAVIPLTSVAQPADQVGREAFAMLRRRMEGDDGQTDPHTSQVKVTPCIHIRKSTL